jgi:hypothetical protein
MHRTWQPCWTAPHCLQPGVACQWRHPSPRNCRRPSRSCRRPSRCLSQQHREAWKCTGQTSQLPGRASAPRPSGASAGLWT